LRIFAFVRLSPAIARLRSGEVNEVLRLLPPEAIGRITGFLNAPRSAYTFSAEEVEALSRIKGSQFDELREAARGRLQRGVDAAPVRAL
jgi:hypothetical protein